MKTYRDNRGFTLIEVMASLVIFSIAVTAALVTFEVQQRSYTTQSHLADTQKNVREAMEMVSRDIRLAGYGIPSDVSLPAGVLPFGLTAIRSIVSDNSSTAPDNITVLYLYDMDSNQPPTTLTGAFVANTTGGVTVASTAGFVSGDLFLVVNDTIADLYKVSGAPTGTVLPNASGGSPNYNTTHHSGTRTYAAGSVVAKARLVKYYVDRTTDAIHPTLMIDKGKLGVGAQPVADDIEDMQFRYTLDDLTLTDNVLVPSRIRQVRIFLNGRTSQVEKNWSEARPAMGDRGSGAATGHRRRLLDVTVDVRNAGL